MFTYNELMKNSKKDNTNLPNIGRLAILGDCATQLLARCLRGHAYKQGCQLIIFDADYNQIDIQLIDTESDMHVFQPDYVLLCMTTEKLYNSFCKTEVGMRDKFADNYIEKIVGYWDTVSTNVLQMMFAECDDRVFGNYAGKVKQSFLYQLRKLNLMIMERSQIENNVFLLEYPYLQNLEGRKTTYDNNQFYLAKMPFGVNILPDISKLVCDLILALRGRTLKCIILDLDQTIWGGIVGDDGVEGIQIGELGIGAAFTALQLWLKELRNRGIILAVCSKNNEETAKEPFLKHPDMILRLEDISVFVANWEDKPSNILYIKEVLNIGMDSIVFLDDNPFERNLVRQMLPEIIVPELPEDPGQYLCFLQKENLFETTSFSTEDIERTSKYQEEAGRVKLQNHYKSYDDYLKQLDMYGESKSFDVFHIPRIAQLTQRSNQFNLRTKRYTEKDIEKIMNSNEFITRYYTLRDRFGEYGLVSVVIMKIIDSRTVFLDTWLMSCRVLKRGVEEFVLDDVFRTASEAGFQCVRGEYIPTSKNAMVGDIYDRFGFKSLGENLFEHSCHNWECGKYFIKYCQG